MEIGFDEAINKIDKTLKLGQLFNVVGGDIFFCICSTTNSIDVNKLENDNFDEQVGKRFENNFNTRFTNMVINIKTKPVRVELIGNCNSKSTELEIIKHYRANPNFISIVDENNPSESNDRFIHVRLYSLPKEWSMAYTSEKSYEHSHTHTHEQGHGHHHHHHHDQHDHHHHHNDDLHHHHEDDNSHDHGHSHTHTHTHSHPGSEETYQCMNFH
ncbi:hypothetical protein ACTFIU_005420 [Dictyostelium citrinum]